MKVPVVRNITIAPIKKTNMFTFYNLHYEREGQRRNWEILANKRFRSGLLLLAGDSFIFRQRFQPPLLARKLQFAESTDVADGEGCMATELISSPADCESDPSFLLGRVKTELGIDLSQDSLQRIVSYRVWGGRLTLYYTSTPNSLTTPLPEGYISVSRSHLSSFLSADRGGGGPDSPEPPLSSEVVLAGEWWKLHAPGC